MFALDTADTAAAQTATPVDISGIDTNRFIVDSSTPGVFRLIPNRTFTAAQSTVPGVQGKGANRQFQLAIKFDF